MTRAEAIFRRQHQRGAFPGGQLVVRVKGEERLNLAIGIARGLRPEEGEATPVTSTTPFQVMSASKPVVAFAVAVLEDRGLLDVGLPVAAYVPEFGQTGKAGITVLDVLTHRGGVLVPALWNHPEWWSDWQRVQTEIWNTPPRYPRGTLAYHPREYGWILGEVIHRVAGQPLPDFLDEALPGLAASLRFRTDPAEVPSVAHSYWLGRVPYLLGDEDVGTRFEVTNNALSTLTSLVPGASMTTTAVALAEFYEMILRGGVAGNGDRLIRREALARYLRRAGAGRDRTSGNLMVVGRGFLLGWRGPHTYGWWNTQHCVGHPGGFCVVAFADRSSGIAAAAVTNGNRGFGDLLRRFAPLGSAIRRSFGR